MNAVVITANDVLNLRKDVVKLEPSSVRYCDMCDILRLDLIYCLQ